MSAAGRGTPTPLARQLTEDIARSGPIGVDDYMRACLHDPVHGYYRRRPAIGRAGDFITAPEISQIFGELIGLWCAVVWQQMGTPPRLRLIELGPGRGVLMRDALRAARLVPPFRAALKVELVEIDAALIEVQRRTLEGADVPVRWSAEIEAGSDPAIVVANEFVDTLPVAQLVYRDGGWRRRCVGVGPDGAFAFAEGAPVTDFPLPSGLPPPRDGDILEQRATAFAGFAASLARLTGPSAALVVDYGHLRPGYGDTLQAISAHTYADPLAAPGEADLTAQVDFGALAAAARAMQLDSDGPITQGEFLGRLGAVERASKLMAANPGRAGEIEAGAARLLAPGGMGGRFLALGIRSVGLAPLPALATVDRPGGAP